MLLSTWQLANGPGMGSRHAERDCCIKRPCIGIVSCDVEERSERTKAALSTGRTNDLSQDSLPQYSSSRRRLWLVSLLLLAIASALVACDTGPTVERTPVPTTAPAFTATPIATMPALTSEVGWHNVLTLGDTSGSSTLSVQKSFTASKPYVIFYSCKGLGSLKVSYGQNAETAPCSAAPELNGTQTLLPAHPGETVTVSASPDGSIIWELLVSMKD